MRRMLWPGRQRERPRTCCSLICLSLSTDDCCIDSPSIYPRHDSQNIRYWRHLYVPSTPPFLPSIFIAHRVQQSHCSSIFHRVLLPHALAVSANQFVRKKKSPRIYTSMHSGGFELTKLTYTRLEDNPIRHRGDRPLYMRV